MIDATRVDFIAVPVSDLARADEFYGQTLGLARNPHASGELADVAAEMDGLRERGVDFQFPEAYDSGVCHMAFFQDPDGNALMLHRRYAPYADGTTP